MDETPYYVSSTGTGLAATIAGSSVAGLDQILGMVLIQIWPTLGQDMTFQVAHQIIFFCGAAYALFGLIRKGIAHVKGL